MKILLIGATAANSGDAPLLLKRAFERQNCDVQFISANEDRPFWADVPFRSLGDVNRFIVSRFSRLVFATAKRTRPELIFIYGSNAWISAETVDAMQKKFHCRVVLWEVNNYCFQHEQAESIPLYDHIFVLDSYLVPVLVVAGARRVDHLCACIDPEEHYRVQLSDSDIRRFGSDLCLLGSAYPTRSAILRNLLNYDLKIYGSGWKGDPLFNGLVSAEPVMDLTKLKIFSAARISLNIHGPHMINGENYRVFEVAACRGVSFSLSKPDLLRCFEPDSEIIIFENTEDLRKKIDDHLLHPDRLHLIGEAAHKRVLAEHTYAHRVNFILSRLSGG